MLSLRTRFGIIIAVISLIPLIILSVFVYNLSYNTILEKTQNQLTSEAYQRGNAILQINTMRIEQLTSFAESDEVQNILYTYKEIESGQTIDKNVISNQTDQLSRLLEEFRHSTGDQLGFGNIHIMDVHGKVIFSEDKSLEGQDFSKNPLFVEGMKKSFRILDLENGQRKALVVTPIYFNLQVNSSPIGVIMGSTSTYFIDNVLLNREGLGNSGESYLVNSDKILITPSRFINGTFKEKVDTPSVRACFENGLSINGNYIAKFQKESHLLNYIGGQKGGFMYPDYRGIPVFGASYCEKDLGYVLLVEIDQQEILAPLVLLQQEYVVIILVVTTSIMLAIIGSSRYVIRPLHELKNAIDAMMSGNFDAKINTVSNDEIGDLTTRFRNMVFRVKSVNDNLQNLIMEKTAILVKTNEELVENQTRINHYLKEVSRTRMALDEASIVAITDKDGIIIDVNEKFCKISKYSRDELIGQSHRIIKSGYHPPEFYQEMWKTITSGNIWRGDIKNMAKDGTFYWVRTTIMPVLDQQRNPIEYIAVRTDITNQKKTEEELRRVLDELKETDRLKDEFGSMISHELRTPLIPIMGYCEMLMDPNLDIGLKEDQHESIKEIYKNSKKLLKMIEDILTVQKLEMRQIKFEKKEIQIIAFMENILRSYTSAMREKMIGFTNTTNENYILRSDSSKLEQVFSNLIQNAIDFVPFNGMIEIGAKSEGDNIVFHVKDNGFGIPKEKQDGLFNKFYQVDTSMKRKHGGTGLGLSICKEIIEGLGGKIWVESEEGKGTIFYFTIPK